MSIPSIAASTGLLGTLCAHTPLAQTLPPNMEDRNTDPTVFRLRLRR